jgi:hypothetical protein
MSHPVYLGGFDNIGAIIAVTDGQPAVTLYGVRLWTTARETSR